MSADDRTVILLAAGSPGLQSRGQRLQVYPGPPQHFGPPAPPVLREGGKKIKPIGPGDTATQGTRVRGVHGRGHGRRPAGHDRGPPAGGFGSHDPRQRSSPAVSRRSPRSCRSTAGRSRWCAAPDSPAVVPPEVRRRRRPPVPVGRTPAGYGADGQCRSGRRRPGRHGDERPRPARSVPRRARLRSPRQPDRSGHSNRWKREDSAPTHPISPPEPGHPRRDALARPTLVGHG